MTQHYKGKRQSQARGFGDSHTLMVALFPNGAVETIPSDRPSAELTRWLEDTKARGRVSVFVETLQHVSVDVPEISGKVVSR